MNKNGGTWGRRHCNSFVFCQSDDKVEVPSCNPSKLIKSIFFYDRRNYYAWLLTIAVSNFHYLSVDVTVVNETDIAFLLVTA